MSPLPSARRKRDVTSGKEPNGRRRIVACQLELAPWPPGLGIHLAKAEIRRHHNPICLACFWVMSEQLSHCLVVRHNGILRPPGPAKVLSPCECATGLPATCLTSPPGRNKLEDDSGPGPLRLPARVHPPPLTSQGDCWEGDIKTIGDRIVGLRQRLPKHRPPGPQRRTTGPESSAMDTRTGTAPLRGQSFSPPSGCRP